MRSGDAGCLGMNNVDSGGSRGSVVVTGRSGVKDGPDLHVLGRHMDCDRALVEAMVTSLGPGVAHAYPFAYPCVVARAVCSRQGCHRDQTTS